MATKDITDKQVCEAYRDAQDRDCWPYELLEQRTGQPQKVCYRAMERADRRGLVEVGVSLRAAWLTEAGRKMCE